MALKDRFITAKKGVGLIAKSFFSGTGSTLFAQQVSPQNYRGLSNSNNGFWFFGNNGSEHLFSYNNYQDAVKAYENCPPIAAIINKKAQSYLNGITKVVNTKGKDATSERAKKILKLMQKPNFRQSQSHFEAQGFIYQQLFGFNVVFCPKPVGYTSNLDAIAMWNISPTMLDFRDTKAAFYSQESGNGFTLRVRLGNTQTLDLTENDCFIFKDFSPSFSSFYLPESRIKAIQLPINNIIGAYESRNVLINRRGAMGILSSAKKEEGANISLMPHEKEELQRDYSQYGLKDNQWQILISNTPVQWQQMGYPTKDLMLFEEIEDSTMQCCNAYSFPYELLASSKGTTFANKNEAHKDLYHNAIIPEAKNIAEQWNAFFDIEDNAETLFKDFSHIPILQEDDVKKATALTLLNNAYSTMYNSGLIDLDTWAVAVGQQPLPEGKGLARATDTNNSDVPLVTILGVGGVQSLVGILQASGISQESRSATLQVVFGLSPEDANRMSSGSTPTNEYLT